jgi:hypothetical protein
MVGFMDRSKSDSKVQRTLVSVVTERASWAPLHA